MLIQLFDNFFVEIIGNPGKKLLVSMFSEYYNAKILENHKNVSPSLVIFLGGNQESISKSNSVPILIAILSKKDYDYISNFCKENNLRLYIAPTKKIFSYYKYLQLPIFDYIHLSLSMSASALSRTRLIHSDIDNSSSIVNIEKELLSMDPHKPFHLRSAEIKGKKHTDITSQIIWEPGTKIIGNKLLMQWIKNNKISFNDNINSIYTIIDIDEIYETNDMKEYLLPFTTLGIYQKGILIVNSDNPDTEETEPFDYHIYTNMMELWNNKHYIPKRLSLIQTDLLQLDTTESSVNKSFDPKFEHSIHKPPIFILDNFDSIYDFISKISLNSIILYIGNEENYKKMLL